ncbi:MAG: hypothetical protein JST14_18060 [Bacteroidetes bacterium]|nr:hypothetical protein [Bacteroidota bacterium]
MEPSEFIQLVRNFTSLTREETDQLREFTLKYPFSQLGHLILARASRDHQLTDEHQLLNLAATYSSDRAILKQLMTEPKIRQPAKSDDSQSAQVIHEKQQLKQTAELPSVENSPGPESIKPTTVTLSDDALRNDLMAELEKLQHLKHAFESAVEEFQHQPHQIPIPVTESIIEEIETSHTPLPVETPSQKEQLDIIDEFIKTNPVLHKPRPEVPAQDLAEESASLSDNVVSETLVQILLKQGRKDKAIEVLKKLIWKFPQKKAYFAAQIDELKR